MCTFYEVTDFDTRGRGSRWMARLVIVDATELFPLTLHLRLFAFHWPSQTMTMQPGIPGALHYDSPHHHHSPFRPYPFSLLRPRHFILALLSSRLWRSNTLHRLHFLLLLQEAPHVHHLLKCRSGSCASAVAWRCICSTIEELVKSTHKGAPFYSNPEKK